MAEAIEEFCIYLLSGDYVKVPISKLSKSTEIRDLVTTKLGITEKKYFQLWVLDDNGDMEIPLGAEVKPLVILEQLQKDQLQLPSAQRKPHTPLYRVYLRMTAVFMTRFERNVKDEAAVELFRAEAHKNFIKGVYAFEEAESARLCAMTIRLITEKDGTTCANVADMEAYLKKNADKLLSKKLQKAKKISSWATIIFQEYQKLTQKRNIINLLYLSVARRVPFYGAVFVLGSMRVKKNTFQECTVGINNSGVYAFRNNVLEHSFEFASTLISSAKANEDATVLLRLQKKAAAGDASKDDKNAPADAVLFSFSDREGNLVRNLIQAHLNLHATYENYVEQEIDREKKTQTVDVSDEPGGQGDGEQQMVGRRNSE